MQGLDALIGRSSRLRVLRTLYHAATPLAGREIERHCGLSNRSTMEALAALTDARAVYADVSGKKHAYTLNRDHYFVENGLRVVFEAEKRFWEDVRKTIRRVVRPSPLAAVATGPAVREKEFATARLELVMLFESGTRRIAAYRKMERLADMLLDRYRLVLAPALLDLRIMNRTEYDNLWKRVEREGLLLWGALP